MRIRDVASQFTVYVFASDIEHGPGVKVALAQAGYDAFFFEDRDRLVSRLAQKPAHVVVFPTRAVRQSLSDFVEQMLKAAPETRFIVIAKPSESESLAAYNDYGLADVLTDEPEGLTARAVFAVDRACERLYMTYQNEQLLDKWEAEKKRAAAGGGASPAAAVTGGPALDERIADYRSCASKEDVVHRFTQFAGPATPCAFLKYLPTVRSLVATHATGLDADKLQGVGCQLQPAEARDFATQISLGVVPPSLDEALRAALGFPATRLWPVFVQGQLDGVVAHAAIEDAAERARLAAEFSLFSLAYSNLALEKRVDMLETHDPVTEVANRKAYQAKLAEEWSRARRIKQPLSVVKIALDDFFELEQTIGEGARDLLLKNVAALINKGSRTTDVTCRTGLNEMAMILPHCGRQGAMIRAERLRRTIETSQMLDNGLKVSVSVGISEYPSLCSTAEDLDVTSTKALAHIASRGGNKLCLYKAPSQHQPEFDVAPEPGT